MSSSSSSSAPRAARRRRTSGFLLAASVQATLPSLVRSFFTVPLRKQSVPVEADGKTVSHKSAYFGTIFVGLPEPQPFSVVFDTGSGHLFLPSTDCQDEPCLLHRRYNRSASASAVDVNDDGEPLPKETAESERDSVAIAYGTGEIVGEFVRETVCLGSPATASAATATALATTGVHCSEVRVVLAREMTTEPFRAFSFDGVLGLGLDALALNPEFHLFGQLTSSGRLSPVFSVFLSRCNAATDANFSPEGDDPIDGEIAFGGHDERRMLEPLNWAPVIDPEMGYWRIQVLGIRVGRRALPMCEDGGCVAVLDTGTSMLGVPRSHLQTLLALTARRAPDPVPEDCRHVPGPPIVFDLGNFSIQLESEDYSRPAVSQVRSSKDSNATKAVCRASFLPAELPSLGRKVFLFGEPVLRKYYTAYDAGKHRVGFALAATPSGSAPGARAANGDAEGDAAREVTASSADAPLAKLPASVVV